MRVSGKNKTHTHCNPVAWVTVLFLSWTGIHCGSKGPASDQAMVIGTGSHPIPGGYYTVSIQDHEVKFRSSINWYSLCRSDPVTGRLFIIHGTESGLVQVVDPYDWKVASEYSVGEYTWARDIAVVSPERAYVARHIEKELLIVHPTEGTELGSVDLSAWADPDGEANPAWMVHHDGKVYVALERLWAGDPYEYSSIVVIDGPTGDVEAEIQFSYLKENMKLRFSQALNRVVVGIQNGTSGGLKTINPSNNTLSDWILREQDLGGAIMDAVILSETKGYAIFGSSEPRPDFWGGVFLIAFNPSTGEQTATIREYLSSGGLFMELTPDGSQLWTTDSGEEESKGAGVRVFDTETDTEITDTAISINKIPSMICFAPSGEDH